MSSLHLLRKQPPHGTENFSTLEDIEDQMSWNSTIILVLRGRICVYEGFWRFCNLILVLGTSRCVP